MRGAAAAWLIGLLIGAGACANDGPQRPISPSALEELGYEWPPGDLRHGGLCSISNPGGNGVVAYTTSTDIDAVTQFYDAVADRVGLHEAFAEGPSLERDGVEVGRDERSTAWRLAEDTFVVATAGDDEVRLLARFSGTHGLTCEKAFPEPDS